MNNKLSSLEQELLSRADSIFESVAKAANTAGGFAKEQLPDIAMQYIAYGRAFHTTIISIWALAFLFALSIIVFGIIKNKLKFQDRGYWSDSRCVCMIGACMVTTIIFIQIISRLNEFLMVWFAPKVYLLQSIATLIKG